MAVVACVLLLVTCSLAGRASSTSSLATGWQEEQTSGKAAADVTWLYEHRKMPPPEACLPDLCVTAELDEVLIKRTSGSPFHRPSSAHRQGVVLEPLPSSQISTGAPLVPHVQEGPALSTTSPSQFPAGSPSAPQNGPGSSSTLHYKVDRRPYGSLSKNPSLKALADREKYNGWMQRVKDGVLVNKIKPDGSKYAITSIDDLRAYSRARYRAKVDSLTGEERETMNRQRKGNSRQIRAKRKAQREAEQEGRTWQGSPVRKVGRPRRSWGKKQELAGPQDAGQHAPADSRMEVATAQHVVDERHAHPTTVQLRSSELSTSSWPSSESSLREVTD